MCVCDFVSHALSVCSHELNTCSHGLRVCSHGLIICGHSLSVRIPRGLEFDIDFGEENCLENGFWDYFSNTPTG